MKAKKLFYSVLPHVLNTIALLFVLTGCLGSNNGEQAKSSTEIATSVDCQGSAGEALKINGASSAATGEMVRYSLNQDMACAAGKTIAWRKLASSEEEIKNGALYMSSFSAPGSYIVQAEVSSSAGQQKTMASSVAMKTVIVGTAANVIGPDVAMVDVGTQFDLAVPSTMDVATAVWNWGDTQPVDNSLGPVIHAYWAPGAYTVSVLLTETNGAQTTITHPIQVVTAVDGLECVKDLTISGANTVEEDQPITLTAFLPSCLSSRVTNIEWNFGDGTSPVNGGTATHTYLNDGTYTATLNLYLNGSSTPWLTLTREIVVTPSTVEPPPVDHKCATEGEARSSYTGERTASEACGVMGTKTVTYHTKIVEMCQAVEGVRNWVEVSRAEEVKSPGECTGQACALPAEAFTGVDFISAAFININGQYYLANGGTKSFYSTQLPAGSCNEVMQTRRCNNGVLEGQDAYKFLLCTNGCAGFGPEGYSVTGVAIGEISQPKICPYGETGIVDVFNQIADRTCSDGQVMTSNIRLGGLKTAGICPGYSWVATENYTTCSADCGGKQTRIYECRDSAGNPVSRERCSGAVPVEERVCDGNPDAVKRSESTTTTEEANSCSVCPANQIGVITKERTVTTTTNYACIDHSVKQSGTPVVTYGSWVIENHCRDYVPWRCSQDSLTNEQAHGRYEWMKKCSAQLPAIAEFLETFEDYKKKVGYSTATVDNEKGRVLYPTFMSRGTRPEKTWKAPINMAAACEMPTSAYVAAVCVSSCATPEQQILAGKNANDQLRYTNFEKAHADAFDWVATLHSSSSMSSKDLKKTRVDNWVTEIEDSEHDIVEFTMKSGGTLRLTPNHPLVTQEGYMRFAGDFKVGQSLVKLGGVLDPIVSLEKTKYFGKVYNVFVKSNALHHNIVVTNGYLNGTAFYQNEGAANINRQIFRGKLIKGVFGK